MEVVLRAAAAYWLLLLAMRLLGRRTTSQLAPFDLVVLFLVAGTTITGVLGDERSLTAAASAVMTFGLMHRLVSWLRSRSSLFGRIVDGTPVIIYENGKFQEVRMKLLNVQASDIMYAVRQRGLSRLSQIDYAVIERDGKISVITGMSPQSDEAAEDKRDEDEEPPKGEEPRSEEADQRKAGDHDRRAKDS